MLILITENP